MPKEITIHIGEYYASAEPVIIKTLLGSCVAVCLFDPVRKIGAMNHILLPGRADLNSFDSPARFGANAMELLFDEILSLGADCRRLWAKIFGGAHVLPGISVENHPGRKISDLVTGLLKKGSIQIVGCDLGGNQGRQIFFHTDTGDVFVRQIRSTQIRNICSQEQKEMVLIRRTIKNRKQ